MATALNLPTSDPHDTEAERRVIGACLLAPDNVAKLMLDLQPHQFYSRAYGWAFSAMCDLAMQHQPINTHTVTRKLSEMKTGDGQVILTEMGGPSIIGESLIGVLPEEAEFWAGIIRRKFEQRELIQFADWARKKAAGDTADPVALRSEFEERLVNLSGAEKSSAVCTGEDRLDDLMNRLNNYIDNPDAITGLETGLAELDRRLDGLQGGNVTIVYAPSSRYKSWVVNNIGWRLARLGYPGIWFTTEMPQLQVQERVTMLEAGLNFKYLRKDGLMARYRAEIRDAAKKAARLPIYYSDTTELDVSGLRAEVMRRKRWNHIRYAIVDLVDMVASKTYADNEISNQSQVMRKMKGIAKAADIHIILVAHIAKGDKATRNAASLDPEDMKGSSSRYQDVDAAISVMPVAWDAEYNRWRGLDRKEIAIRVREEGWMYILLDITKNRHGEQGEILCIIDLNKGGRLGEFNPPRMVQAPLLQPQAVP